MQVGPKEADKPLSNGRVLLCLSAGLDQKHFTDAILRTFRTINASDEGTDFLTNPQGGSSSPNSTPANEDVEYPTSSQTTLVNAGPNSATDASTPPSSTPATPRPTSTVQALLAERRERLDRDKKDKEAAEKAEKRAKADARRDTLTTNPEPAKAKQASYAQEQRKRQQEAKLERERILREIEHDKAARREKEEQRKALVRVEAQGNDGAGGLVDQQLAQEAAQSRLISTKECALQVRLFDGSTIRQRFAFDQTLRSHVRPWIERQRSDGDTPYTFKQILTPKPNRTLSISEEEESLQSLGLTPSSTLVMVPVQGYTAAYTGEPGLLSRGISAGYNIVSAGAELISGTVTSLFSTAAPQAEQAASNFEQSVQQARSSGSEINVRTLRDQLTDRDDHQLYNGNQVSRNHMR